MGVLIAVAAVCIVLCGLMIGLMVLCDGSGRAQPKRSWGNFCGAIFFLLFAAHVAWQARHAELTNTVVPARGKAPWMSPTQAYVAAGLVAVAALVLLMLSLRSRPKTSDSGATPTI